MTVPLINFTLIKAISLLPKWFAKPFAKPYVAGETIKEAIDNSLKNSIHLIIAFT